MQQQNPERSKRMHSIHQTASNLGSAQVLAIFSVLTIIVFRNALLKIMIAAGIALIVTLLVSGAAALLLGFR
jgi:hypothetical protein